MSIGNKETALIVDRRRRRGQNGRKVVGLGRDGGVALKVGDPALQLICVALLYEKLVLPGYLIQPKIFSEARGYI